MRPSHPLLARAHARLMDWADWYGRMLTSSRIGYPGRTGEARLLQEAGVRSGQPAGSLVPLVDIPAPFLAVDRAMRDLPEEWRAAVYAEVFPPQEGEPRRPVALFKHRTGRSVQASPARTEVLLRGFLNTWALYGLSLADAALYDEWPDMRVDQYPVFRRFYSADPAKRTKYETQFFDMLREATELRRTLREMDKINRPDVADELERRPRLREYGQLNRVNRDLQAINREVRQAYIDDGLSPEQKRQVLDELTLEKNQLLEAVVKDIEAQRAGN